MSGRAYSQAERAEILASAERIGVKPTARLLGVGVNTIYRWLHPEVAERTRAGSRAAKKRRKRPCTRGCGRLTSYDRPGGVCVTCLPGGVEPAAHGTRSAYNRGCRCAECTRANTDRHREYMQRKRAVA